MSDELIQKPRNWRRAAPFVIYGVLGALLVLILTAVLDRVIPSRWATRVAYNSEAYLFALVLGIWIQFGLPRVLNFRVWISVGHAVVWALVGIGLLLSELPSRVVTLNETAFALAALIPYVSMRRPLSRWVLGAIPVLIGLTIWAVVWSPHSWVIDQAETFGFVVLAMLTFDVFDRSLLQSDMQGRRWLRWAWYSLLILEPIIVSALGTDVRDGSGATALVLQYLGRIHESFIGVLLVSLVLHLSSGYHLKVHSLMRREAAEVHGTE